MRVCNSKRPPPLLGFCLLSIGLTIDIVVRGVIAHQTGYRENWDLLPLLVFSGLAAYTYQWIKRVEVAPRKWIIAYVVVLTISAAYWGIIALLK